MKNKVLYVMLIIVISLLAIKNVKAESLEGSVLFEKQEYLNIFYELNNQTPLANFLMEHGFNILDYFEEKALENDKITSLPSLNAISLQYASETGVSGTYEDKQPYYVVRLYFLNSIQITESNIFLNTEVDVIELIYSEDMTLLNSYKNYIHNKRIIIDFNLVKRDITKLFSRSYFVASNNIKLNSSYDAINLTSVYVDKKHYKTSEWRWLEMFARMSVLNSVIGDNSIKKMGYDFENNMSLNYYKTNPVVSKQMSYKSLGAMLFEKAVVQGPANFQTTSLSLYPYGIYFTPKSSCGEECDYTLYVYSSFGDTEFYTTSYLLGNKFQKNKDIVYSISSAFQLQRIELTTPHELSDILKYTFLFTVPNKTEDFTLYYDLNSWDVVFTSESSNDAIITGADGTKYVLSKSDMYINNNDSMNSNNTNSGNGDTINPGVDPGKFDFSAGTILNGFKSFVGSVSGIASSITSFLSNLPVELVSLLYSGFTMGIIAMIIKIVL